MRLIAVRLRKGEFRLDAFVRDDTGKPYRIPLRWYEHEPTDLPPKTWAKTVRAEFDLSQVREMDVLTLFRKRTR